MKVYLLFLSVLLLLVNVISLSLPGPASKFSAVPGPAAAVNISGDAKVKAPAAEGEKDHIQVTFKWTNIKKEEIVSLLKIPKKTLNVEVRNFGISADIKMLHPRYLKKQGFKLLTGKPVVDYREVYSRNLKNFKEITADLKQSAQIKQGVDPLVDFLRFTQQMDYRIPPKIYNGRYIREFYTPLLCLEKKMGDCDTKTILLADLLGALESFREELGIVILKGYGIFHAILAIKRKPLPGTLKLYFRGKGYFMPLEVSGPGWNPGFVGRNTFNCLKAGLFRFGTLN
ncbi:MAG: hypothetical protein KAW12_16830 [Candidatus Aminicenantes bacterium]|nr:hypothetical protein [Candidatus Aminicenantes bacterium]